MKPMSRPTAIAVAQIATSGPAMSPRIPTVKITASPASITTAPRQSPATAVTWPAISTSRNGTNSYSTG